MVIKSQDSLCAFVFENTEGVSPGEYGLLINTQNGCFILGEYDNEEQKKQIINEICEAYADDKKVYQMPLQKDE